MGHLPPGSSPSFSLGLVEQGGACLAFHQHLPRLSWAWTTEQSYSCLKTCMRHSSSTYLRCQDKRLRESASPALGIRLSDLRATSHTRSSPALGKIPMPLKLLSNCKIHSLSYDSQFVLQVFLIRITAVDCNCNTATLCQPSQCTYPSFCPILHVEAALSSELCSYPLCCITGEPIISILASVSEESLMILNGINWIFIPTAI